MIFRLYTLINTDVDINLFMFGQINSLPVFTSFWCSSFLSLLFFHRVLTLYLIWVRMLQINFHALETYEWTYIVCAFACTAHLTQHRYCEHYHVSVWVSNSRFLMKSVFRRVVLVKSVYSFSWCLMLEFFPGSGCCNKASTHLGCAESREAGKMIPFHILTTTKILDKS